MLPSGCIAGYPKTGIRNVVTRRAQRTGALRPVGSWKASNRGR